MGVETSLQSRNTQLLKDVTTLISLDVAYGNSILKHNNPMVIRIVIANVDVRGSDVSSGIRKLNQMEIRKEHFLPYDTDHKIIK